MAMISGHLERQKESPLGLCPMQLALDRKWRMFFWMLCYLEVGRPLRQSQSSKVIRGRDEYGKDRIFNFCFVREKSILKKIENVNVRAICV
jgi:hypothetical protein